MSTKAPPKRETMLAHLEKSESVYVKFDARREGVVLPAHLRRDAAVVLQYGLNMRIPIPDLDVGAEGIGATLSFNRNPVWTFIPWSAVFAVVSEAGAMLWESDLPRDLELDEARGVKGPAKKADPRASKPPKRPSLRAVDGGRREEEPATPSAPSEPSGGEKMASLIDELPSEPLMAAIPEPSAPAAKPVLASAPSVLASVPEPPPVAASSSAAHEPTDASPASEAPTPSRPQDEIVELPSSAKKKRELPPWLRVVK